MNDAKKPRRRVARYIAFSLLIISLLTNAVTVVSVSTPPTNIHIFAANTKLHVVGGDNSYLTLANDVYADSITVSGSGIYGFNNAAMGARTNPTQTFSVRIQSGNLTLNAISTNSVQFTITAPTNTVTNTTFYYPSAARIPTNVVLYNSITIGQSQFLTSQTAYASCATPCVFINSALGLIEILATNHSPVALLINDPVFVSTACGVISNFESQVSGAAGLLAISLIVVAAIAIIVIITGGLGGGRPLAQESLVFSRTSGALESETFFGSTVLLPLALVVLVISIFVVFTLIGAIRPILGC